nr:hypothetical protein [uncultured Holophaga sp.]
MRKLLLALPLVIGTALSAQDSGPTPGFTVGFSAPTGDFASTRDTNGDYLGANNGLGVQIGGHLDFDLDRHSQIRLHLTANNFVSEEQDIYTGGYYDGTRQNNFTVLQMGGDFIYNAVSPRRGGYFLAGVNLNHVRGQAEYSNYADSDVTEGGRLGARIGGGVHLNRNFSLEAHLNTVSVDKADFGYSNITWLAVNAVFRFGR